MEKEPRTEEQIIEELKSILEHAWENNEVYDSCVDFARILEKKHPEARSVKLFRVLIGSTPPENLTEFDFPGEDSIETFIRSL